MTSVVALIPARSGSKGVPGKNVRELGGRPLLAWTIAACLRTSAIERVIVSTDSGEYAHLAVSFGAEAPFLRPAEISNDSSTDYEFIAHALDWLDQHGTSASHVVHMRPTTPVRDPQLVGDAIDVFMRGSDFTALRSLHEMSESAYKAFEIAPSGYLKSVGSDSTALDHANNARQKFPKTYQANGYVDVLSTAFIRRSGHIHGDRVQPFLTPSVVEVDTEDDFEHLEFQISRAPYLAHKLFS
jgi:CMP-N,N'-diacetyllegionaminic acid synthase